MVAIALLLSSLISVAGACPPAAAPCSACAPSELPQVLAGPHPADRFGASLVSLGDVDGDGVPDLAIGAPRATGVGGAANAGLVRVVSGGDGATLFTLRGDSAYDTFGWAVAAVGDLDGDGVPDLAVGAPAGEPSSGRVSVHDGADGRRLLVIDGELPGDRFGHSLAGVGDADGDGVPDLLVGAPHSDASAANGGRATLHSGADGTLLFGFEGASFDQLGLAVAGPGDVDGDGRGDLLVGAPFSDATAFNGGSAFLHSGADGRLLAVHHGAGVGDLLGHALAAVGDVDGDGVPDLGLAAPFADIGGLDAGAVWVRSGADGELLLSVTGEQPGEYLGALAGAGDVDGDGLDDLVVGAASGGAEESGRVRVVSGASGAVLIAIDGARPFDWLGAAVAGLGDLDGDGVPEIGAGAPVHDDVLTKPGSVRLASVR